MNQLGFKKLCEEFTKKESALLNMKARDYTAAGIPIDERNRLQNFYDVGSILNMRPSEVAITYLLKHIHSIVLAVQKGKATDSNWMWHDLECNEGLMQRIADARNYLLLLAACLQEEVNSVPLEAKDTTEHN